jgi:transcriptional regulator with XRE-family HTH domain
MVHFLPMNIYQERLIQWLAWDKSRGIDLADYQYAERAGMKPQAFSHIKHGHRKTPAHPTVEKLALAFGISHDEFLVGRKVMGVRFPPSAPITYSVLHLPDTLHYSHNFYAIPLLKPGVHPAPVIVWS